MKIYRLYDGNEFDKIYASKKEAFKDKDFYNPTEGATWLIEEIKIGKPTKEIICAVGNREKYALSTTILFSSGNLGDVK